MARYVQGTARLLISTNPTSTEASDLELTRGTYFVANRLEYVIVSSTLQSTCYCGGCGGVFCGRGDFVIVFASILANAHRLRHASLLAKQSRHVATLIGRKRNTRNTRSSSSPQRSNNVAHGS